MHFYSESISLNHLTANKWINNMYNGATSFHSSSPESMCTLQACQCEHGIDSEQGHIVATCVYEKEPWNNLSVEYDKKFLTTDSIVIEAVLASQNSPGCISHMKLTPE